MTAAREETVSPLVLFWVLRRTQFARALLFGCFSSGLDNTARKNQESEGFGSWHWGPSSQRQVHNDKVPGEWWYGTHGWHRLPAYSSLVGHHGVWQHSSEHYKLSLQNTPPKCAMSLPCSGPGLSRACWLVNSMLGDLPRQGHPTLHLSNCLLANPLQGAVLWAQNPSGHGH